MTITQKSGKEEITIHGSPEQIEKALEAWDKRIGFMGPYHKQCGMIRDAGIKLGLENAANVNTEDILKAVLERLFRWEARADFSDVQRI